MRVLKPIAKDLVSGGTLAIVPIPIAEVFEKRSAIPMAMQTMKGPGPFSARATPSIHINDPATVNTKLYREILT